MRYIWTRGCESIFSFDLQSSKLTVYFNGTNFPSVYERSTELKKSKYNDQLTGKFEMNNTSALIL